MRAGASGRPSGSVERTSENLTPLRTGTVKVVPKTTGPHAGAGDELERRYAFVGPPARMPPSEIDPARCKPVYPKAARRSHLAGTVVAEYTVTVRGRAKDIQIKRSVSGLDGAESKALERCRFHPATEKGKRIAVTVMRNFRFELPP